MQLTCTRPCPAQGCSDISSAAATCCRCCCSAASSRFAESLLPSTLAKSWLSAAASPSAGSPADLGADGRGLFRPWPSKGVCGRWSLRWLRLLLLAAGSAGVLPSRWVRGPCGRVAPLLPPPKLGNSPLLSCGGLACCAECCGWKDTPAPGALPGCCCCFVRECQPPDRAFGLLFRSQSRGCCNCGTYSDEITSDTVHTWWRWRRTLIHVDEESIPEAASAHAYRRQAGWRLSAPRRSCVASQHCAITKRSDEEIFASVDPGPQPHWIWRLSYPPTSCVQSTA